MSNTPEVFTPTADGGLANVPQSERGDDPGQPAEATSAVSDPAKHGSAQPDALPVQRPDRTSTASAEAPLVSEGQGAESSTRPVDPRASEGAARTPTDPPAVGSNG